MNDTGIRFNDQYRFGGCYRHAVDVLTRYRSGLGRPLTAGDCTNVLASLCTNWEAAFPGEGQNVVNYVEAQLTRERELVSKYPPMLHLTGHERLALGSQMSFQFFLTFFGFGAPSRVFAKLGSGSSQFKDWQEQPEVELWSVGIWKFSQNFSGLNFGGDYELTVRVEFESASMFAESNSFRSQLTLRVEPPSGQGGVPGKVVIKGGNYSTLDATLEELQGLGRDVELQFGDESVISLRQRIAKQGLAPVAPASPTGPNIRDNDRHFSEAQHWKFEPVISPPAGAGDSHVIRAFQVSSRWGMPRANAAYALQNASGRRWHVHALERFTIGRDADVSTPFGGYREAQQFTPRQRQAWNRMSRKHLEIHPVAGGVSIVDLRSSAAQSSNQARWNGGAWAGEGVAKLGEESVYEAPGVGKIIFIPYPVVDVAVLAVDGAADRLRRDTGMGACEIRLHWEGDPFPSDDSLLAVWHSTPAPPPGSSAEVFILRAAGGLWVGARRGDAQAGANGDPFPFGELIPLSSVQKLTVNRIAYVVETKAVREQPV